MVLHYWDHLQRALHSSKVLAEELHLVVLVWQFHFADAVYPKASKMDLVLLKQVKWISNANLNENQPVQ